MWYWNQNQPQRMWSVHSYTLRPPLHYEKCAGHVSAPGHLPGKTWRAMAIKQTKLLKKTESHNTPVPVQPLFEFMFMKIKKEDCEGRMCKLRRSHSPKFCSQKQYPTLPYTAMQQSYSKAFSAVQNRKPGQKSNYYGKWKRANKTHTLFSNWCLQLSI